jgi:hypothetical protein
VRGIRIGLKANQYHETKETPGCLTLQKLARRRRVADLRSKRAIPTKFFPKFDWRVFDL